MYSFNAPASVIEISCWKWRSRIFFFIEYPFANHRDEQDSTGKIAVIGGCREYTGAPYFAAISALKIRCCSSYKSYSPELIVHPVLEESYSVRDEEKHLSVLRFLVKSTSGWKGLIALLLVLVLEDPFLLDCVGEIMRQARESKIPTVIDGDGLFLVTNNLDLVKGNTLAILTPNINEYKRLVEKALGCEINDQDASQQLASLASQIGGPTILRKGKTDLISDGLTVDEVDIFGSPRRCGGQGDILSGSVAVFSSWARQRLTLVEESYKLSNVNPMVLGSIAGSALLRKAASLAYANKKRSTLTTDIIDYLGRSLEHICPAS
ncbi:hypothetical protein HPP92_005588 [Vanilla planifolia]|uniref:ATP-dependent (S)-NAD(P)H-hydrate dehydratase n=1 Tax=Vanilla planifolia TaxID=51239 RepID=A0A835VCR6_VANPL|nr:hypothetical protein HPP92_005588 [Vanilla planifolia]